MRPLTLIAPFLPVLVFGQDITHDPEIEVTLLPATISAHPAIDVDASLRAEGWVPASTIITHAPSATPISHLDLREIVGGAAAAQPSVVTQASPVTQVQVNGVLQIYTQTFPKIPDQLPGPSSGSIGLGTIQGTVGGVEKRNTQETATPKTERRDASGAGLVKAGTGSIFALLIAVAAAIA